MVSFFLADFRAHCDRLHTKNTFSGVGAKHMNGIAERNIKKVAQWAQANMLHLAHSWPKYADPKYWPQAINYATWVFNNLPNTDSGISPNEIWSNMCISDDIFKGLTFLAALSMSWTRRSRMARRSPSGLLVLALASSLAFPKCTLLKSLWSSMSKQRRFLHSFM